MLGGLGVLANMGALIAVGLRRTRWRWAFGAGILLGLALPIVIRVVFLAIAAV